MMKSCFSTLACPDWSLPEILTAAANYGYDGVELRVVSRELDLWKLPELQPSSFAATRSAIADHGLMIAALGSSACFHSPDAQERARNFDVAVRMAELAEALGAPSIRVFGDRIQPGCTRADTAGWIADSLVQLAARLKSSRVEVWLETHGDFAAAAEVSRLLTQLQSTDAEIASNIGVIWDPANAFAQSGEIPAILPNMVPHIRHVHLKDMVRDTLGASRYVPTGEGNFPLETMFAALSSIAFDGFVSFEWEKLWRPELAAPEIALPHFIQWWKQRMSA